MHDFLFPSRFFSLKLTCDQQNLKPYLSPIFVPFFFVHLLLTVASFMSTTSVDPPSCNTLIYALSTTDVLPGMSFVSLTFCFILFFYPLCVRVQSIVYPYPTVLFCLIKIHARLMIRESPVSLHSLYLFPSPFRFLFIFSSDIIYTFFPSPTLFLLFLFTPPPSDVFPSMTAPS